MVVNFKEILEDSIIALGEERIIDNPFQVAIIEYDVRTATNQYKHFSSDLNCKVLLSLHPQINFFKQNYKENF